MDEIERLRNRQLARLLSHLKKTGQLTPALRKRYEAEFQVCIEDIENLFKRHDKENDDGESSSDPILR